MDGDLHDFVRIGVAHHVAYPRGLIGSPPVAEQVAELCADDYFDFIELSDVRRQAARAEVLQRLVAGRKAALFAAGPLQVREHLDLNAPWPRQRARALDELKEALDRALELKALAFTVISGRCGPAPEEDVDRLVASLKELCEVSRAKGAPPVLLTVSDEVPPRAVGAPERAEETARAIVGYYPRFGLSLPIPGASPPAEGAGESLRRFGPYLKHVEIRARALEAPRPANGLSASSPAAASPCLDADGLAAWFRLLKEAGFFDPSAKRPITLAVRPPRGQSVAAALAACKSELDEAWKRA